MSLESNKKEDKPKTVGEMLTEIIKTLQYFKVQSFQHSLAIEKLRDVQRLLSEVS